MASRKLARGRVEQALAEDQQRHAALVRAAGEQRTRALLEDSARDLERRLRVAEGLRAPSGELARHEFTLAQLRATLAQVRSVLKQRTLPGLKGILVDGTAQAADGAAQATVAHLARADAAFRGVGTQPLALDEARLLDRAAMGAHSSLLHRLSSGGTTAPGADSEEHHAKAGILARYGASTIEHFERVLQLGVLQRKSWRDMRDDLRKKSPFLMGKPAWWAQRIVRTELMGAAGRGAWEASREADEQLGDVVKIISSVFDDRTGCLVGASRVTAGVVRAVFRRRYQGAIVRVRTERGRDFTATPNHPVLGRQGWVRADLLREGDYLVCNGGDEYTGAPGDEHVANSPTTIGEFFEACSVLGHANRRRGSEEDFHGDGMEGQVDVLRPHGKLRIGAVPAFHEPLAKQVLAPANNVHACGKCGAILGASACEDLERLGAGTDRNALLMQASGDEGLRYSERLANAFDRFTRHVAFGDSLRGDVLSVARVIGAVSEQARLGPPVRTGKSALGQGFVDIPNVRAHRCRDGGAAQPGLVQLDRVIGIEVSSFDGHVFNLETDDGYYCVDGVYTGNSDSYAVHGQIRRPDEAFESWYGLFQHPPDRPNDRGIVVVHRIAWPLPPSLLAVDAGAIAAAWAREGRKGPIPPRPQMTTVPIARFGRVPDRRR